MPNDTFTFADALGDKKSPNTVGTLPAKGSKTFSFDEAQKGAGGEEAAYKDLTKAYGKGRMDPEHVRAGNVLRGVSWGLIDELGPDVDAGLTGLKNLGVTLTGGKPAYGMGDTYNASKRLDREAQQEFNKKHPLESTVEELAGGLVAPGAGAAGKFILRGGNVLTKALRAGAVGAGAGATQRAAASSGDVKERLSEATTGAIQGGIFGGMTEGGLNVLRVGIPALNRATGYKLTPQIKQAMDRLEGALRADGLDKKKISEAMQVWSKKGLNAPELVAIGGENTAALIRAAASKLGPGRQRAADAMHRVREDLADQAVDHTHRTLTPHEGRTSNEVIDETHRIRDVLAEKQFPEAYARPIKITPQIADVLRSPEGRKSVYSALDTAMERRDDAAPAEAKQLAALAKSMRKLDEIDQLRKGDIPIEEMQALNAQEGHILDTLPTVSGGALHRVQIAMRDAGREMYATNRAKGQGVGARAKELSAILDSIPHLREARRQYGILSEQARGVRVGVGPTPGEQNVGASGRGAVNERSRNFKEQVGKLKQEVDGKKTDARSFAQVGARQAIEDFIEQADVAGSRVKSVGQKPRIKRNLEQLFSPEQVKSLTQGMNMLHSRFKRFEEISPRTGSQTALRSGDAADIDAGKLAALLHAPKYALVHFLNRAQIMDAKEADMLVRLGIAKPELMDRVLARMNKPRTPVGRAAKAVAPAVREAAQRLPAAAAAQANRNDE